MVDHPQTHHSRFWLRPALLLVTLALSVLAGCGAEGAPEAAVVASLDGPTIVAAPEDPAAQPADPSAGTSTARPVVDLSLDDQDAPTGGWRLASSESPYLRQHADNAVDWYEWGDEAFALAKEHDLPVFLSVGYSSCHWCHVMEHESFEDEEVAALLREGFISIKVDREQRPDIDAHYMKAVQGMTGRGGWPMTVIMTPDGKPFFGGTYFPPEGKFPGSTSFTTILTEFSRLWREDRQTLLSQGDQVQQFLLADPAPPRGGEWNATQVLADATTQLLADLDGQLGGFQGAPKFPPGQALRFLIRRSLRGDAISPDAISFQLDAMATSGLWDHVGGGFHRYCVDELWRIPHFEKMLYDNAILAATYAEGYALTGQQRHADVARATVEWALREMQDEGHGLFYSAQDADSMPFGTDGAPLPGTHPEEGLFYAWSMDQLKQVLGDEDGARFALVFGATDRGNFENGLSHLQPRFTREQLGARTREGFADGAEFLAWIDDCRARLMVARAERPAPFLDTKCIAGWNGLMLSGLAKTARYLDDDALREETSRLAFGSMRWFMHESLGPTVGINHQIFENRRSGQGDLFDHAALGIGFVDAYEATADATFLQQALRLARDIRTVFENPEGGFFDTVGDDPLLPTRGQDVFDGAVPSGNSLALELFARLAPLDDTGAYDAVVESAMERVGPFGGQRPRALPTTLVALDAWVGPMAEIVIDGTPGSPEDVALVSLAQTRMMPASLLIPHAREALPVVLEELGLEEAPGLLYGRESEDGSTAWVCTRGVCQLPVQEPEGLTAQLEAVLQR